MTEDCMCWMDVAVLGRCFEMFGFACLVGPTRVRLT
jgi:hypothetical protein